MAHVASGPSDFMMAASGGKRHTTDEVRTAVQRAVETANAMGLGPAIAQQQADISGASEGMSLADSVATMDAVQPAETREASSFMPSYPVFEPGPEPDGPEIDL